MIAVPGDQQVTRPLTASMDATDASLLLQVPPGTACPGVNVVPAHFGVAVPVMAAGPAFTLTTANTLPHVPPAS